MLQRVKPSDVIMEPYPHVVVPNALPDDLYERLAAVYPFDQTIHEYAAGMDKVTAIVAARCT